MGSGIRYKIEWAALALMATVGIMVLLSDLLGLFDTLIPRDALPKITLLILSTVTLFLLLEIDRLKLLDGITRLLSQLDIERLAGDLKRDHYAGVTRVRPRLSEDTFLEHLNTAAREVSILQTWIPNLHRFEEAMVAAIVRRNVRVRILLLHPASPVADLRREALRSIRDPALEEDVKANVERCLCILENIFNSIGGHRDQLEVRVYNSLSSIAVYKADERYFVSSFLHGRLAIDSTQVEIDGADTAMGREVQSELDILWEIGSPVDLRDWRASINRMYP
jgi:hypothetical protein